jgi:hypothetical protein
MPGKGPATLVFAVRLKVVVWLLGELFKTLVGLALFPLGVALIYQDLEFAVRCAIIALAFLGSGWAMARIEAPQDVRPNDAMLATALVFLIAAIAMTWPFIGAGLRPLDAWFESVSAITTTGLTTVGPRSCSHAPGCNGMAAWLSSCWPSPWCWLLALQPGDWGKRKAIRQISLAACEIGPDRPSLSMYS